MDVGDDPLLLGDPIHGDPPSVDGDGDAAAAAAAASLLPLGELPRPLPAPRRVRVAEQYPNPDDPSSLPPVQAFAKLAGHDWTYYIKAVTVVIGRSSEGAVAPDEAPVDVDLGPTKTVSRKHAAIVYNFETAHWEMQIYGRNGIKIDSITFKPGVGGIPLRSGHMLEIGGVQFLFLLPTAEPETGAGADMDEEDELITYVDEDDAAIAQALASVAAEQEAQAKAKAGAVKGRAKKGTAASSATKKRAAPASAGSGRARKRAKKTAAAGESSTHGADAQDGSGEGVSQAEDADASQDAPAPATKPKRKRPPRPTKKQKMLLEQEEQAAAAAAAAAAALSMGLPDQSGDGSGVSPTTAAAEHQAALAALGFVAGFGAEGDMDMERLLSGAEASIGGDGQQQHTTTGADGSEPTAAATGKSTAAKKSRKRKPKAGAATAAITAMDGGEPPAASTAPSGGPDDDPSAPPGVPQPPLLVLPPPPLFNDDGELPDYMSRAHAIDYSLDENKSKRPPYSYASLIAEAICSSPIRAMSLGDIYEYLAENYAYLRYATHSWQNSIRHNLSLNRAFVKRSRPDNVPGKGYLWTIDPFKAHEIRDDAKKPKKRAAELFPPGPPSAAELAVAVAELNLPPPHHPLFGPPGMGAFGPGPFGGLGMVGPPPGMGIGLGVLGVPPLVPQVVGPPPQALVDMPSSDGYSVVGAVSQPQPQPQPQPQAQQARQEQEPQQQQPRAPSPPQQIPLRAPPALVTPPGTSTPMNTTSAAAPQMEQPQTSAAMPPPPPPTVPASQAVASQPMMPPPSTAMSQPILPPPTPHSTSAPFDQAVFMPPPPTFTLPHHPLPPTTSAAFSPFGPHAAAPPPLQPEPDIPLHAQKPIRSYYSLYHTTPDLTLLPTSSGLMRSMPKLFRDFHLLDLPPHAGDVLIGDLADSAAFPVLGVELAVSKEQLAKTMSRREHVWQVNTGVALGSASGMTRVAGGKGPGAVTGPVVPGQRARSGTSVAPGGAGGAVARAGQVAARRVARGGGSNGRAAAQAGEGQTQQQQEQDAADAELFFSPNNGSLTTSPGWGVVALHSDDVASHSVTHAASAAAAVTAASTVAIAPGAQFDVQLCALIPIALHHIMATLVPQPVTQVITALVANMLSAALTRVASGGLGGPRGAAARTIEGVSASVGDAERWIRVPTFEELPDVPVIEEEEEEDQDEEGEGQQHPFGSAPSVQKSSTSAASPSSSPSPRLRGAEGVQQSVTPPASSSTRVSSPAQLPPARGTASGPASASLSRAQSPPRSAHAKTSQLPFAQPIHARPPYPPTSTSAPPPLPAHPAFGPPPGMPPYPPPPLGMSPYSPFGGPPGFASFGLAGHYARTMAAQQLVMQGRVAPHGALVGPAAVPSATPTSTALQPSSSTSLAAMAAAAAAAAAGMGASHMNMMMPPGMSGMMGPPPGMGTGLLPFVPGGPMPMPMPPPHLIVGPPPHLGMMGPPPGMGMVGPPPPVGVLPTQAGTAGMLRAANASTGAGQQQGQGQEGDK